MCDSSNGDMVIASLVEQFNVIYVLCLIIMISFFKRVMNFGDDFVFCDKKGKWQLPIIVVLVWWRVD